MRFAIVGNAAFTLVNFRNVLIRDIAHRGHTVFALAPDFEAAQRRVIEGLGAEPVDYCLSSNGLNPLADLPAISKLRRTLQRLRPDISLCYGIKTANYGTLAARLAGVPSRHVLVPGLGRAFTRYDQPTLGQRTITAAAQLLYRSGLRHSDTVFVQNRDDADDLVRLGITTPNKICLVQGTGVELNSWLPVDPVLSPVTFLMAARLIVAKGVVEFVHAARIVKARHPKARFVLIGALEISKEAVASSMVEGWVREGLLEWPGHVDMTTWLSQASVFVLPSFYREGIPRSTQEAMALARAVVTTDSPGCRETVVDGRNGFLVAPRDPSALASAMERFVINPDLIVTMGAESRKLAEERFDVRKINSTMISRMGL